MNLKHFTYCFVFLCISVVWSNSALGQVDDSPITTPDTLYLIEEETIYDTLYVYDSIAPEKMMTKAELLKALCADRGVGTLKYQKRHFYITTEESLIKLEKPDLKLLFAPKDYADYEAARKNQLKSIPLWVGGIASVGVAAWGLYNIAVGYYSNWFDSSIINGMTEEELVKSRKLGFPIFIIGTAAAGLMLRYAVVITNGGEETCHRIARRFRSGSNVSFTPTKLTFGASPGGIGITFDF